MKTKHVESQATARLDGSSTLPGSTKGSKNTENKSDCKGAVLGVFSFLGLKVLNLIGPHVDGVEARSEHTTAGVDFGLKIILIHQTKQRYPPKDYKYF